MEINLQLYNLKIQSTYAKFSSAFHLKVYADYGLHNQNGKVVIFQQLSPFIIIYKRM